MSIIRLSLFCAVALCANGAFAAQSAEVIETRAITGEFNAPAQATGGYVAGEDAQELRPRTAEILHEADGWVHASELQSDSNDATVAQPLANSPRWVF